MDYREIIYRRYAEKFQASGYQRPDLVVHWTRAYRWYFRRWLPASSQAAILDVGCGGGQMLQALQRLGYSDLHGVDASEQQVRRAREAGLDVRAGDAMAALRESPGRWDLILAIDILEHLQKGEALEFLSAAHAALKPGGRLIVQMPNPDARAGMKVRYGDLTHEIALGPEAAGRLLDLFGYGKIEARELGPVPRLGWRFGPVRWVLWQFVRLRWMILDVIETGSPGARIHTRVYLISACRPEKTP
ncbi:MAG: class I SAM-dependent methyltransferase [Opitutaceae bacterium]|nr:class I SAM-dependent methyltransferase [Opitutaceae bacterium]